MSRTDAHRPPRVHLTEAVREYHDHTLGGCDLPPLDEFIKHAEDKDYRWNQHRCTYWLPVGYQHEHSPYSKYSEEWTGRVGRGARRGKNGKKAVIRRELADMSVDGYDMGDDEGDYLYPEF